MYFFLFLSRRQRGRGSLVLGFDRTPKGGKSTGCSTVRLELCSVLTCGDLYRRQRYLRFPFKGPRQLSLPASALSARARLTMETVSPPTTGRPLPWGRPARDAPAGRRGRPGGCSRSALPEKRSPQLFGREAGRRRDLGAARAALPGPRPPGPSPGYLVLAAAPAALLAAQQLRDGQRGRVRLVRCGGQAHVGAGSAADVQENRGGAEKASADLTAGAPGCSASVSADRGSLRPRQTSRAAPPPPSLRPHGGRMRQCRPAGPRRAAPLARRSGGWRAGCGGRRKNNLERPSSPQKLILTPGAGSAGGR